MPEVNWYLVLVVVREAKQDFFAAVQLSRRTSPSHNSPTNLQVQRRQHSRPKGPKDNTVVVVFTTVTFTINKNYQVPGIKTAKNYDVPKDRI